MEISFNFLCEIVENYYQNKPFQKKNSMKVKNIEINKKVMEKTTKAIFTMKIFVEGMKRAVKKKQEREKRSCLQKKK